jgi:hypothetical protein
MRGADAKAVTAAVVKRCAGGVGAGDRDQPECIYELIRDRLLRDSERNDNLGRSCSGLSLDIKKALASTRLSAGSRFLDG